MNRMILTLIFLMGCKAPAWNHSRADNSALPTERATEPVIERCDIKFTEAGLCASLQWQNYPASGQPGSFYLKFYALPPLDQEPRLPLDPGWNVESILRMSCCGTTTPPLKLTPVNDIQGIALRGAFRVSQVTASMPGQWELWIQLKNDKNEIIDKAKLDRNVDL